MRQMKIIHKILQCYHEMKGKQPACQVLLVNAHISSRTDTAASQLFKDDRGVNTIQCAAAAVFTAIDGAEANFTRFLQYVERKMLLQDTSILLLSRNASPMPPTFSSHSAMWGYISFFAKS
jgi:hypothetical protein